MRFKIAVILAGIGPVEGTGRQGEDRTPVRTGRRERRRRMMELEAGRAGIDAVLKCPPRPLLHPIIPHHPAPLLPVAHGR